MIFVLLAELGLRKPPSLAGEKVAPSRFRCGQAIAVNRGKRDIHGSREIHGLQLVKAEGLYGDDRVRRAFFPDPFS